MQRARTAARPVAYTHAKIFHRCFFLSLCAALLAQMEGREVNKLEKR
jgi:hypothetical protein